MPQTVFLVRSAAALLVAMCAVTSLGAQRFDPRDVPPSEERLLNRAIPDVPLTTAAGARVTVDEAVAITSHAWYASIFAGA